MQKFIVGFDILGVEKNHYFLTSTGYTKDLNVAQHFDSIDEAKEASEKIHYYAAGKEVIIKEPQGFVVLPQYFFTSNYEQPFRNNLQREALKHLQVYENALINGKDSLKQIIQHISKMLEEINIKYPNCQPLKLVDHSPIHDKIDIEFGSNKLLKRFRWCEIERVHR